MTIHRLARTLGTCACCVSLVCAARAAAQTLYHVQPIGSLPGGGDNSYGEAINNHGQVVGDSSAGNYTNHPFLWDPVSGMIDLGFLPGGNGWGAGMAVNDAGHAAGWSDPPDASREAFFWSGQTGMIGLGDLPGGIYFSKAFGINDLDEVVGFSASDAGGANDDEAFLWREDIGMIGLGDLPGGQYVSVAIDINNATQVVGWSVSYDGNEAFLWDPANGMVGLGFLQGGGAWSFATAINELGQVVGAGSSPKSAYEAFLWDPDGGMIALGLLPDSGWAAFTFAEAINERGQVVGRARRDVYEPLDAFIWDAEHGTRSLTGLLGAAAQPPYDRVSYTHGINNAGQIVAYAPDANEAVILTPFVLGDMNCDGVVDAGDVAPFALALVDYAAYAAAHPGCHGDWAGDTNQDAAFDARDIPTFIECLLTECP